MTVHFDSFMFPASPENSVAWAPVLVEPVIGSGERISIGVAFVNGNEHRFQPTLKNSQIKTLFGAASGTMQQLISIVHAEFDRHVEQGGNLDEIEFPLSGFRLGRVHHVNANSIAELMDSAMMMSSAFVAIPDHDTAESDNEDEKDLSKQIRNVIALRQPGLKQYMGIKLRLRDRFSEISLGFAGPRLAANFGRMTPGQGLNTQLVHAKAKILDLASLRRHDQSHRISQMTDTDRIHYELLLLGPPADADYFPQKQRDQWGQVVSLLVGEGDDADVRVVSFDRTEELVERIVEQEVAA